MVFYKRYELIALRGGLGSPPVFSDVRLAHLFTFLCCCFCFVCLRPVSCLSNVASFSGLSTTQWPKEKGQKDKQRSKNPQNYVKSIK
jgi:hypothetical protein